MRRSGASGGSAFERLVLSVAGRACGDSWNDCVAAYAKDAHERKKSVKKVILATLLLAVLALGGCTQMNIEAQAYAVSMGIDWVDNERIRVSMQTPSLNQSGSSESGGESGGDSKSYTLSSADGRSLSEALNMLQASIPREMNLSGIKSIVVSQELAESERFREVLHEMAMAYRVYGAAELIVCKGEAQAFIESQHPVIGLRLSESISVELAHCRENGYIPSARAADVYYLTESFYGDPVAVLAAKDEKNGELPTSQNGDVYAGEVVRTGDNKNMYFGAALFRDGRMTGMLTGAQTQLLNMILGDLEYFGWIIDGKPVNLNISGRPTVQLNLDGEAPIIDVELTVNVFPSEKGVDMEKLRTDISDRLQEMTAYCQARGVDPFRYAERAAAHFQTVQQWLDYDWNERFLQAQVRYDVKLQMSEL